MSGNIDEPIRIGSALVVLEGIDGAGKSTQAQLLQNRLESLNIPVLLTHEPTYSEIGKVIRRVLSNELEMDERALALLYAADRIDHLTAPAGILRHLESGNVIVCDRYCFSSYAYHSDAADLDWLLALNSLASSLCKADITLFLDIAPEDALARLASRHFSLERYETLGRLKRIRDAYWAAFYRLQSQECIRIIDGGSDVTAVAAAVWSAVSDVLFRERHGLRDADT